MFCSRLECLTYKSLLPLQDEHDLLKHDAVVEVDDTSIEIKDNLHSNV